MRASSHTGEAWLFTFPFWIFVDSENAPQIRNVIVNARKVRFYPPFRSGPANFIPMPYISAPNIPFEPSLKLRVSAKSEAYRLATVPNLGVDSDGKTTMLCVFGESWTETPKKFPMDSLRIDVANSHDAVPNLPNSIAIRLMEQLRWRSKQWWISRSIAGLLGYVRNSFEIDESGRPLGQPDGLSAGRTVNGFENAIDAACWNLAIEDIELDRIPPEYDVILLDAYYHASVADIRRSILDAASACEQVKDLTAERLWRARHSGRYRRGRTIPGYDLPQHLDAYFLRLVGRSIRIEHPTVFEVLLQLWDSRGRIAHGGRAAFRSGSSIEVVHEAKAVEFARAADLCIRWLEALS